MLSFEVILGVALDLLRLVLCFLVSSAESTLPADSSFSLRYQLPTGWTYTYEITTDQFVIKTARVRLHSTIIMDVVGHDENGNSICRFRLKSDSIHAMDDDVVYRTVSHLNFGGHRLYAEAGHVELILDAFGRLVDNSPTLEDLNKMPETSTQFQRTVDANTNDPDLFGSNGSYMLQFIMPSIPSGTAYELKKRYWDTVTFNSKSVHLPTTFGVGTPDDIRGERKVLTDTLIRSTVLDSVRTENRKVVGYMTLTNQRSNALGGRFVSETKLERDMTSGAVQSVNEICYKHVGNEDRLAYNSRAKLVFAGPTKK